MIRDDDGGEDDAHVDQLVDVDEHVAALTL